MLDRLLRTLFYLSVLFLAFMLGIVASIQNTIFYQKTKEIYEYAHALEEQYVFDHEHFHQVEWAKEPEHKSGVTVSDPQRYYKGLTYFTTNNTKAMLVDMQGNVVHSWSLPYGESFGDDPAGAKDKYMHWEASHVYPNGDLVVMYLTMGQPLYGRGIIKIDKDSKLIWKYEDHCHHWIDVGPDGTIYTFTQQISDKNIYDLERTQPPFMDEYLAILDANGKLIKKISLIGALKNSPYVGLLNRSQRMREMTHANYIKYVDAGIAAKFPFAKQGELLVSLRDLETIILLDPQKETVTWAYTGQWELQHNPSFLDNGHMLVFDNQCGGCERHEQSRVLEFDPVSGRIFWMYGNADDQKFYSDIRGRAQRLPNGNTFIVAAQHGRMLEVTPEKKVVWEYYNPVRAGNKKEYIAFIAFAERFPENYFTFLH